MVVHNHFVREKALQEEIKMCQAKIVSQFVDMFSKELSTTN